MTRVPTVLALNQSQGNRRVLSQLLERSGFRPLMAGGLDEMLDLLASADHVDLVLIDVSGFRAEIWNACEILRQRQIPFLVISPMISAAINHEGLAQGARAVLGKPLKAAVLINMIRACIDSTNVKAEESA